MRHVSPGLISFDSSPTRKRLNDPSDEDANLLVRMTVLGHDAVRRQLDEAQCDPLAMDGADDDALPDLLRRDRRKLPERAQLGMRRFHREVRMIVRVWHGWTRPEDADAYEQFLRGLLSDLPASVSGSLGGWVLRRPGDGEEEFVVMTLFESLDAIRAFAGDDYETPVIEPEAARLLVRGDEKAAHYEAVVEPS